jgi:hypothetical protein
MKALPVGELKSRFSEILDRVKEGETFTVFESSRGKRMILDFVNEDVTLYLKRS